MVDSGSPGAVGRSGGAGPLRRLLHDARIRGLLWQVAIVAAVLWLGWWLAANVTANLERQRIATGFGLVVGVLRLSPNPLLACLLAAAAGLVLALPLARRRREAALAAGRPPQSALLILSLALLPPLALGLVRRPDLAVDWPVPGTFRISGGAALSPEFTALLVGLSLANSASIAEIVRSGIQAVPKGQWEAAGSLGLHRGLAMRLVVLPQALRIMIPPMVTTFIGFPRSPRSSPSSACSTSSPRSAPACATRNGRGSP